MAMFTATLQLKGRSATGIPVPAEVLAGLGGSKRPAVTVTLNDYTYRTTVGVMAGESLISVSAEVRAAAGVAAGDTVDVQIELDTEPRTVTLPADLDAALDGEDDARRFFAGLSPSQQKWFVTNVESAKKAETRARRVVTSVEMLRAGRAR
jgi:hypothetical protein